MADVNGWTPAHVAAYNGEGGWGRGGGGGHKGVKKGVKGSGQEGGVQMADVNGWTPAHVAACNGEGGDWLEGGGGCSIKGLTRGLKHKGVNKGVKA